MNLFVNFQINQPFKDHLIHNVTEFYTAEYVTFFVDILNGSNANCFVNIQRHGFSTTYSTKRLTAKSFATNYTFSTAGIYLVRAWCKNFLIINEEISQLSVTVIVRPIEMRNFTLTLTPKVVAVNHAFSIYIIMTSGTEIFCIINSTSANISLRSSYPSLSGRRYITGGWHRYPFSLVTSYYGTPHTITVTCENSLGRVIDSRDIQVQIPVSNLVISANETICIGSNLTIYSALSAGAPVTIEAVFDRITTSSINSTYTISNHTFNFPPSIYRNISGWKFVEAKASNAISQIVSNKVWIKFSAIIQSLNVSAEFDVPPNPAPFQAPSYILPTSSSVTFNTNVDPFLPTGNYLYAWKIGDGSFSANSTDPSFSHIFYNSGVYSISTKVVGCQEEISTENFTAVNPVEYFDVTVTPWPYIAVNFSIKLNISRAKHSECMEVAFGDKHNLSSETLFGWNNCRAAPPSNYSIATGNNTSDLAWFIREYPVTKRGNYTILITAVNLLYMINRNFSILAGDCYIPTFNATGEYFLHLLCGPIFLLVYILLYVKSFSVKIKHKLRFCSH